MKIEEIDIGLVKPYSRNARDNSKSIQQVANSIEEFGWQQPIVVDKENVIIVGHTRFLAAKLLKYKKVPVLVATDLTKAKVKAYRIADNKTGERSEWDADKLMLEMEKLDKFDYDITNSGFSQKEIEDMFNKPVDLVGKESDFKSVIEVIVSCTDEDERESIMNLLKDSGFTRLKKLNI